MPIVHILLPLLVDQEKKSILSGHALGGVVLRSQGKPLSFTVCQLLVDMSADHLIRKSGGRLATTHNCFAFIYFVCML